VQQVFKLEIGSRKKSLSCRLPVLYDIRNEFRETEEDFFSWKPPSFTRSFCRSLFSQVVPPIRADFVVRIVPMLTPVFAALAYPRLTELGLKIEDTLPVSKLRLGFQEGSIGRQLAMKCDNTRGRQSQF
jgi:hypothetical protein